MRSSSGAGRHIGTMIDATRMIHASEPAGSVVIEQLSRSFWGRRVLGFYTMEDPQ
jgi:cell wall-associated NlpC family hydrolase